MTPLEDSLSALRELGPAGIERFAASLDPSWISEALAATKKASVRRRKLPADQAVWLVLGMALFADRSIRDVVDHLSLVIDGVTTLAPSSIPQARARLGPEPLKWLFDKVATAWADSSPGLGRWRGYSLFAVDGVCLRVADTDENLARYGKPGVRSGANEPSYPVLRMTCLMNLGTRMLCDASFDKYVTDEHTLARKHWSKLPDKSVTILDRGFHNYVMFAELLASGSDRHVLVRMRENLNLANTRTLPDGTELAKLQMPRQLYTAHPELQRHIDIRIVEYQHEGGKPGRLLTTLLDPKQFPAKDLIELYHDRWEIELAYDELKTHMLERKESLRSKRPEGVAQELWGCLLVYNLVRREMLLAAEAAALPPQRISFRSSLMWIRNFWLTAWMTSPGALPKHLGEFRSQLDVLILPPRRSERRYPRHVKIKISKYRRNPGRRNPVLN